MNHLAHFKVAYPDPGLLVGSFLGDFVKGRLKGEFPIHVERGIRLHRSVDAYVDSHPTAQNSARRFASDFRRYGPIMVDVIYDHFLAEHWQTWHHESIDDFCETVFSVLAAHRDLLPSSARKTADRMMASRSLAKYHHAGFVAGSFEHISQRLTRNNPLANGYEQFARNREELRNDFNCFFPELLNFTKRWQQEN